MLIYGYQNSWMKTVWNKEGQNIVMLNLLIVLLLCLYMLRPSIYQWIKVLSIFTTWLSCWQLIWSKSWKSLEVSHTCSSFVCLKICKWSITLDLTNILPWFSNNCHHISLLVMLSNITLQIEEHTFVFYSCIQECR